MYARLQSVNTSLPIEHVLETTAVVIGRDKQCTIHIQSPSVSSKHALIEFVNNEAMIKDLSSTNGTFLNHRRITNDAPIMLHTGDILRFGYDSILYTFKYEEYVQEEQLRKEEKSETVKHNYTNNHGVDNGNNNLDHLLRVLESRISDLEKYKKHPYPFEELETIEKALLVKIYQFSSTLLNQQEPTEQGYDKINILETVCNQLEVCVRKMHEHNSKINEFEQYSKTLERKVSDFRVKLWEMEKMCEQTLVENRLLQAKCSQFENALNECAKQADHQQTLEK